MSDTPSPLDAAAVPHASRPRRQVRPLPAETIRAILDGEPVSFVGSDVANDRAPRVLVDPAIGGWPGLIIMVLVAAAIGAMLAIGSAF